MLEKNQPDRRLIEDYLPIEEISAESRREKSVRKGHISTLHLWWARRPLVACRAAVFGALVPAGAADAKFVAALCKYPGPRDHIQTAQRLILEAHAERLSVERGEKITVEDIEAGRAPRPRVLDMFAGGGAIPLEALRLGCETYALDLNPVAHLIELCTLVYPQQFGQSDLAARGSAKDGTWAGLATEVEHWGNWVLERAKKEIGDLYPPISLDRRRATHDDVKRKGIMRESDGQYMMSGDAWPGGLEDADMLTPVAYLWTRTVHCKSPACDGIVPLARQTWLVQKKGRFVALTADASDSTFLPGKKRVRYRVIQASTEKGLGFDPAAGSKAGNVVCPFCGTVVDSGHVKEEGKVERLGLQLMVVVCTRNGERGKVYIAPDQLPAKMWPDETAIWKRIHSLENTSANDRYGSLTVPDEPLPLVDARGAFYVKLYGFEKWGQLFSPRQLLTLLTLVKFVRLAHAEMLRLHYDEDHAKAITTYAGLLASRTADWNSGFTHWTSQGEKLGPTFTRMALAMVWDFVEINPFVKVSGNAVEALERFKDAIGSFASIGTLSANVMRGSATALSLSSDTFDAVITDPPYYDNVPYADLSDFFYVWLKRSIGFLYPEHFSSTITPKKQEAIMDAGRHKKSKEAAKKFYENSMAQAFAEAGRVLKPGAPLAVVYAHKTTLGWATLVDALRVAGFTVTEAWPINTERPGRPRANDSSALASSITLVARRREGNITGSYENDVQPELHAIVRERVETLWGNGVSGADLVIACVGAGLRAYTRFGRVEYANGEEAAADRFLSEVEGVVLETLLEKLFGLPHTSVSAVDAATRFYVLWRFAYRAAAIDAGEAIIFAYPQGVELDGPKGISHGLRALVEREKSRYRLRDFTERGDDDKLGLPGDSGPAPLIDMLHRLLWLMENQSSKIAEFLDEARPNLDHLRVVAETLAGAKLAGNGSGGGKSLIAARGAEAAALRKLTTNWRGLIEAKRGTLV